MKQIKFHLKSDTDAVNASEKVLEMPCNGKVDVIIKNHESDRTLAQNRLAFKWYAEMGKQSGAGKEYERNYCKWHLGFPILLAREDVEEEIVYMHQILSDVLYEKRMEAMELVEVTRLFRVDEFTEYLRSMERHATDAGWYLSKPEDEYNEAMGRYRV